MDLESLKSIMRDCRGKVTADVRMDLRRVEAEVDMRNSGNGMSTQGFTQVRPLSVEVKTYSC